MGIRRKLVVRAGRNCSPPPCRLAAIGLTLYPPWTTCDFAWRTWGSKSSMTPARICCSTLSRRSSPSSGGCITDTDPSRWSKSSKPPLTFTSTSIRRGRRHLLSLDVEQQWRLRPTAISATSESFRSLPASLPCGCEDERFQEEAEEG